MAMGEHADLWKQQIPKIFLPICTSGIVRRLNYGKPMKKTFAIATTSQENVIICQRRTLLKAGPFPFSDSTQLLLFRVDSFECTEYLVAQSPTKGIVLVNILNFEVKEAWPTAIKAELFDWEMNGSQQLKITFPGGESKMWNEHLLPQENSAPLQHVLILKDRLQAAQENINEMKAEIHTKERMLASSLSRFHDTIPHVTSLEVPNLMPILRVPEPRDGDLTQTLPVLALGPVSCQKLSTGLRLKFSVSNRSEKLIENLHCYLTSSVTSFLRYFISGENYCSRKELEPQNTVVFTVSVDYPVISFPSLKLNVAVAGSVDGKHFSACLKPTEFEMSHNLLKNQSIETYNISPSRFKRNVLLGQQDNVEYDRTSVVAFPCKKLICVKSYMHNVPANLICEFGNACNVQPLNKLENTQKMKHYVYLARDKICLKTYIHALYSLLPDDALILPVSTGVCIRTEENILEECFNILLKCLLVNGSPVKVLPLERYREMCENILTLLSE